MYTQGCPIQINIFWLIFFFTSYLCTISFVHVYISCIALSYATTICYILSVLYHPCFYEPNYTIQTTTQCQRNNLLNTQFIYIYIYIHINKFFFQRVVGNSATLFKIIYRNTYLKQSNGERSWRFLVHTC